MKLIYFLFLVVINIDFSNNKAFNNYKFKKSKIKKESLLPLADEAIKIAYNNAKRLNEELDKSNSFLHKLKEEHKNNSNSKPKGRIEETKDDKDELSENSVDLTKVKYEFEDWMMIASNSFKNPVQYPPIFLPDKTKIMIELDEDEFRLNNKDCTDEESKENPKPDNLHFWFRIKKDIIFYASTINDMNILDTIKVAQINNISDPIETKLINKKTAFCINIEDDTKIYFYICSYKIDITTNFYCILKKIIGDESYSEICSTTIITPEDEGEDHIIHNPTIIIPLPSRMCNELWDYRNHGDNWECKCKEGQSQSPIDLPKINKDKIKIVSDDFFDKEFESKLNIALNQKNSENESKFSLFQTEFHPMVEFYKISYKNEVSTIDGLLVENEPLKFMLRNGALKILHHNMGKMVKTNGATYKAEEILIHTPSEHTIDGKRYDMEIQVIFYGISKGDIAKQTVMSFLFEGKEGVYNYFIDDLNFENLPSRENPTVSLTNNLYIPKIFYSNNSEVETTTELQIMKPFSFYKYKGSLSFPPCSEDTDVYVIKEIFPLSKAVLNMFQQALIEAPVIDKFGNLEENSSVPFSNRSIQPKNNRPIFYYDHTKYCEEKAYIPPKPEGHYEKQIRNINQYFFVNSNLPSGIPGAFIVEKNEAIENTSENNFLISTFNDGSN